MSSSEKNTPLINEEQSKENAQKQKSGEGYKLINHEKIISYPH